MDYQPDSHIDHDHDDAEYLRFVEHITALYTHDEPPYIVRAADTGVNWLAVGQVGVTLFLVAVTALAAPVYLLWCVGRWGVEQIAGYSTGRR